MELNTNRTAETVCPLDCADTCSLQVDISDDRVVKVRGSKKHSFTNGKICTKVATGMVDWVHGDKRIQTPLRRIGKKGSGQYEPISWDQAYTTIKQKFADIIDQYGAEAILPLKYGGPMGVLSVGSMDARFFNRLGASQLDSVPLCAGVTAAAWNSVLGPVGSIAHTEMAHSKLIVIWANNITVGHLHLITTIRQARKSGAKIVVIDPKRIRIADDADLFIQITPGTDVVLAYAVANQINKMGGLDHEFIQTYTSGVEAFLDEAKKWSVSRAAKECGIAEAQILRFAEYWCTQKPASLTMGVALERNRNGGSAIRAAMALPLLTGNFVTKGAGICNPSSYFNIDRNYLKRPDLIDPATRTINILDVGQHIANDELELPIKALFIYNHNPVAVHPRQKLLLRALEKEDLFTVGYDLTMTDSMHYADIILPACSAMEYGDLYKAYGHTTTQRTAAIIPPVGESRANTRVFRELADVFGFDGPELQETDEQMLRHAMTNLPEAGGQVDRQNAGDTRVVFRDVAPATKTGKALFYNPDEELRAGQGLPTYQALETKLQPKKFTLVSPSSDKRINSTLGSSAANQECYQVEISLEDAQQHHFNNGQSVKLVNEQAEVVMQLLVTDKVKQGLAYVPKGAWRSNSQSNLSVNALIPGHKADMADGACYNDTQVDIVAVDIP